jgi:hypothetical protein
MGRTGPPFIGVPVLRTRFMPGLYAYSNPVAVPAAANSKQLTRPGQRARTSK